MGRNVRLKIARIPQFADEFTESVNKKGHMISGGSSFNLLLIVFRPQEEVTQKTDVTQQL